MPKMRSRIWIFMFFIFGMHVLFSGLGAQEKASDPILTLDRIFGAEEFKTEDFGPARWLKDRRSFTTIERSEAVKGGKDIVLYRAETGAREILISASKLIPEGEEEPLKVENYDLSNDGKMLLIFTNTQRVWRQNTRGDYWIFELETGRLRKLGGKFEPATLMFAKLSPDGRRAAYLHQNDIYAEDIATGSILRLTWDGGETTINGTGDWVYEEEFDLRDGFRWSPDGRLIAFWQFNSRGVPDFHMINNTDSLYPKIITFKHPKPGQPNSACRVGVVSVLGGYPVWIKAPGDPRNTYIARMDWAGNSEEIVFQHLNRLQNTLNVMIGDGSTGEVRTIFTDHSDAWVDVMDSFYWVGGGKSLLCLSERDGWQHAYLVARDGKQPKLLTPGLYDIISLDAVDETSGWLYLTASPENATQRYLHRVKLDGKGKLERISPAGQSGTHSYQISPSARWAIHTYSNFDTPPVKELVQLPGHKVVRVLAANQALKEKVGALKRRPTEFFRLNIGDGVELDGWSIKPPDFDPAKKYPLFIYVYGEPAGTTVVDSWGRSRHLWQFMLAQQGYIVASFENRGTPQPRGREWRKYIYRQVGILASADQAAAVRAALKMWPYVDPERIGIFGWSGGGTMTLNALFRYPDLYKTGIAVASVADQRYYDSIYQERYMGLPKDNEKGYSDGSPIKFAHQLKGNLLIVHGTADDNVHYQNFEALVNELISNNIQFTMMAYPNRSHGISEGKNTTLHVYTTITRFLNEKMPPGPK